MAKSLYIYIASVFTVEDMHVMSNPTLAHKGEDFDTIICTLEEVARRTERLSSSKFSGPDGCLPRVWKKHGT
ncbi:hypothetical protein SK128_009386, partial [Halocaridina rubra]